MILYRKGQRDASLTKGALTPLKTNSTEAVDILNKAAGVDQGIQANKEVWGTGMEVNKTDSINKLKPKSLKPTGSMWDNRNSIFD